MSSTIELLQIGCTAQQLIDTVNALVAAYNDGANAAITSYNDLTDKPRINGVTLSGSKTTEDLKIKVSEAIDFNTFEAAFASKGYVDAADASTLAAASAAVDAALEDKMDKDLSNISEVTSVGDGCFIPIATEDGLKKIVISSIAAYTKVKNAASVSISAEVPNQRQQMALSGQKNGENMLFSTSAEFVSGSTELYLNGQLLTAGSDYLESSSSSVTMLTYVPNRDDILVLFAIPKI